MQLTPTTEPTSEARERVLDAAEILFSERGYAAVTLRDVAQAVGIRQASLYHHMPEGKTQLYVAVMERGLARHRAGLERAMREAGDDLEAKLRAAAAWMLSQPPMNLSRMARSDFPAIGEAATYRLSNAAYTALWLPLMTMLDSAKARGEATMHDAAVVVGAFLAVVDGVRDAGGGAIPVRPYTVMADEIITVLLDGLRPR